MTTIFAICKSDTNQTATATATATEAADNAGSLN